ncbi:receptor-like protein 2 [Hordeum vulgare subsp. vulgare]|uniref:Leucine-rich repeat-containing N-terminal plant-type domain-containing protein n=1 Tax=Hordeum vulgare subsp. vulgare TaxID=112509 RepID=A0A8I6XWK7_HORVV|nr:receptor-like protein 2 [Hordeum vulgare subsp. vulgare]
MHSKALVALQLFLLLLCLASPANSCTEHEEQSLLQFLTRLSQDGGLVVSWRNGTDCCGWEGITCNREGGVAEVSLASRGLEGHISPHLAGLTGLLRVNLSHNSFSGGLPPELMYSRSIIVLDVSFSRLSGVLHEPPSSVTATRPLQVLNISSNQFGAEFPSHTWKVMQNLVVLNASNNSFTGHIPPSICLSPSLAMLDLCYNQLSGGVPAALGDCSMLRLFKVGHNKLSGTLPVELFHATSLEHLSFASNGLQGELDGTSIVKLSNLVTLDLRENRFSGKIPRSIGQLKRLEELYLGNNNMSGEVPSTLSNCTRLMVIDLKINNFSGDLGRVNFSTLQNLTHLDVLRNNFSGIVPENIYSCSNLVALRVSLNHFHGEISPRIGNLQYLSFLSLARNPFTNITKAFHVFNSFRNITILIIAENFVNEMMPQDETLDGLRNLEYIHMADSALTGHLPVWLSKLRNLKVLKLSNNRLSGPMPGWINSLHSLFYLDVSNNSFTGQIPITLMDIPMLKDNTAAYLDPGHVELPLFWRNISRQYHFLTAFPTILNLSINNFTGVIPPEIGQLKVLSELDFSSNKLYGVVPLSVCNLTKLEVLDLSNNHLSGVIPAALEILHFLSAFNISNNDLEGPVPTGGQLSTFPDSSFDGNPKLCGIMLVHRCSSTGADVVYAISAKQPSIKVIFFIGFGLFFGVGVLYDQLVLYRYFG